jgi:predicted O-methyltransferase YrrM
MSKTETLNHCHVPEERAWLFHSENSASTEEEYLYLLYALVYCLKPLSVLETGTYQGMGTVMMARALQRNSTGHLLSVEIDPKLAFFGRENLRMSELTDWATVVVSDSMDFLETTTRTFDFAFFDSALPLRVKELQLCLDRKLLRPGSFAALHDTSRLRTLTPGNPDPQSEQYWKELEAVPNIKYLEFPLSRGLTLLQVTDGSR